MVSGYGTIAPMELQISQRSDPGLFRVQLKLPGQEVSNNRSVTPD